jgi:hypothetical protein
MDAPGKYEPVIYRTLDWTRTFSMADANGDVFDLTDWSAESQIRATLDGDVVHEFTPEITDAAGGVLVLSMTAAESTDLTAGTYYWDLILITPEGDRLSPPVLAGQLTVREPVTRPA